VRTDHPPAYAISQPVKQGTETSAHSARCAGPSIGRWSRIRGEAITSQGMTTRGEVTGMPLTAVQDRLFSHRRLD